VLPSSVTENVCKTAQVRRGDERSCQLIKRTTVIRTCAVILQVRPVRALTRVDNEMTSDMCEYIRCPAAAIARRQSAIWRRNPTETDRPHRTPAITGWPHLTTNEPRLVFRGDPRTCFTPQEVQPISLLSPRPSVTGVSQRSNGARLQIIYS